MIGGNADIVCRKDKKYIFFKIERIKVDKVLIQTLKGYFPKKDYVNL